MTNNRKIVIHTSAIIKGIDEGDSYIEIVQGQFEKRFQELFERFLPEKPTIFDIGANIGIVSIIAGKIRPGGQVYAFEAGEGVFKVLNDNIINNFLHNVKPVHCAVADFDGTICFSENSAYGHAVEDNGQPDPRLASVNCYSIDTLVDQYAASGIDLIKLDIEGFEPQALKGASRTIRAFDPVFLMELNPWCIENYGRVNFEEFTSSIFDEFKYVYIINKYWNEDRPIREIGFNQLMDMVNQSENLFVDDLVFCNSPKLSAIAALN